jgi:aryl-alcohol dehydrogenase-like predicted oxidoreductase
VLSKSVVPIPGTRHIEHLQSNRAANDLVLRADDIAELEAAFPAGKTAGSRFQHDDPNREFPKFATA